jgi:glycosyltransferase involved in cell wall biosynthesis
VPEIALSVVVPVYNQAESIAENVRVIRDSVTGKVGGPTEIIVVSDGSLDETAERALENRDTRVIHYDRNLGKGYAVKTGALEARGRWIAYVDADLDLDPAWLPDYVRRAEEASLDFAIGSKRHPESLVSYPPSRRAASWLFQRFVRVLFRIDVRDTQVGIKVFRREVAEEVLPLLLVKRFAFDLELLAVAKSLGFGRIEEQPIRLDYRFTGSGVRSVAVLRALVDTAAIFYRLRILRYYARKRRMVGRYGWTRPRGEHLRVAVVGDPEVASRLDYPELEIVSGGDLAAAAERTEAEILALIGPGAVPAGNWLSATVPFLSRPEIGGVVTTAIATPDVIVSARAGAAKRESRLGGGLQYFRYLPGNLRYVDDYPTESLVVRRDLVRSVLAGVEPRNMCAVLAAHGTLVLYTPESTIASRPASLFREHLTWVLAHGRNRGRALRTRGIRALRLSSLPPLLFALFVLLGWPLLLAGGAGQAVWVGVWIVYLALVVAASAIAGLRFRSLQVGLLALPGFVLTHAAYVVGFAQGLVAG